MLTSFYSSTEKSDQSQRRILNYLMISLSQLIDCGVDEIFSLFEEFLTVWEEIERLVP